MMNLRNLFKRSRDVTETCLAAAPCAGPTSDWSGPEIPLAPDRPISAVMCGLFEAASKENANKMRLILDEAKGQATFSMKASEDWIQAPGLGNDLWSHLVLFLPRIASIESCQGVIKDPASDDEWRFNFTKEANQITLNKIDSADSQKTYSKRIE